MKTACSDWNALLWESPLRQNSVMARMRRVAVVTGANRGIGFEISRQLARRGYAVILTARDPAKGRAAVRVLAREGLDVTFHQLDVTDAAGIKRFARHLRRKVGRLDVLVNNAGIYLEGGYVDDRLPESVFDESVDKVRVTMETNLYGPYQLCQALIPLMREGGYGRVVNVSSRSGQLNEMGGREAAYRMSKTALNALTRILAAELRGDRILVNAICPGWVATDMGGSGGRPVAQGAAGIVWAATLPDDGPTGGFFRDGRPIDW
jgi:NAD(P)-dependent dehydrogenase (short-subunit alcohol dehydrogenase family)